MFRTHTHASTHKRFTHRRSYTQMPFTQRRLRDALTQQSWQKARPSTTLHYKACTKHFPVLLCTTRHAQNTSQYYFVLQSLRKPLPSTALYRKAFTYRFTVLLCTTKLSPATSQHYFVRKILPRTTLCYKARTSTTLQEKQRTSQYYFAPQSLCKVLPSTALYCKACTSRFPVLLCTTTLCNITLCHKACGRYFPVMLLRTTKLLQSTSHHYFVLQTLRKVLPNSTSYYKACRKWFPVCFVLQSLQKALPSTTSYCKACRKYFPILSCTHKLAESTSQYNIVLQSLHRGRKEVRGYYFILQS